MNFSPNDHTFVICAYKENKYLEKCIMSLKNQSVKSNIIISTSTPNKFIDGLAKKYDLCLYINNEESSLSGDWNFAASCVNTKLYTICHQDDYYFEEYLKTVLEKANTVKRLIFIYTNYVEDKKEGIEKSNLNLIIKKIMNIPMKYRIFWKSKFVRRRVFSIGNPVCCPSVTFNKEVVPTNLFDNNFKNDADWDAWERLSKLKGEIIYCPQYLMAHRIYSESTTSQNIENNIRNSEDLIIFKRFWPHIIAVFLNKLFKYSEKNND